MSAASKAMCAAAESRKAPCAGNSEEGEAVGALIECVAIFYAEGKSKLEYTRKEKFRLRIPRNLRNLVKLKTLVR